MMEATRRRVHFFPLTTLQIGDLQSYLSQLSLFLAPESKKIFVLVDNRPWLTDHDARPAHLWQLMVTKSRFSPFANTRTKSKTRKSRRINMKNGSTSNLNQPKRLYKWFTLIDSVLYRKSALLPVKKLKDSLLLNNDLHHILNGLIIFEISWNHVRGISYLNELQTDTSMALEAKIMKRWEFDSIQQASNYSSLWFSGTSYESLLLQEYLNGLSGEVYYDAQEDNAANSSLIAENVDESFNCRNSDAFHTSIGSDCKMQLLNTPPICGSYKRRKIMKSMSLESDMDEFSGEAYSEVISSPSFSAASTSSFGDDGEVADLSFGPSYYKDVLILFRFSDPDLPFELKKIIVSDLRLLRLLEYGLPSWVIFLQSYPVFCNFYRPWMCPLARGLYILVSMTTVLIGFYDLYKNVPVLKATASRLCGPFFEWIESWEMISRIRYLGTMLFIQHFEKAVAWFLMISRAMKSLLTVLTKPLLVPILELMELLVPVWNACLETAEFASSMVLSLAGSICDLSFGLVEVIFLPLWSFCLLLWSIATSVLCPLFWIIGEILVSPFRIVMASAGFIVTIGSSVYAFLLGAWSSISGLMQLASATEATVEVYEVSMWQSLWNDLFSQIFRAIRSILYGLITFFSACNRHRLSIYNHLRELFHMSNDTSRTRQTDSVIRLQKNKQLLLLEESPKSPQRHSRRYKKKLA